MKYFVVKVIGTAKESNPNFKGCVICHYYGKDQSLIGGEDIIGNYCKECGVQPMTDWKVKEYGYKRMCDAKRSWMYNNPCNEEWHHWTETTEIVEVEI